MKAQNMWFEILNVEMRVLFDTDKVKDSKVNKNNINIYIPTHTLPTHDAVYFLMYVWPNILHILHCLVFDVAMASSKVSAI